MAVSEREFLAAIARKLGREPLQTPPPRPGHARTGPQPPAQMAPRDARAEWFEQELTKLSGTVERVSDLSAAGEAVAAHIKTTCEAGGDVVLWDDPIVLAAKAPLEAAGFRVHVWPVERMVCAGAVAGVTTALFGIAETGSVALDAGPGHGRSVSLLPPLHVVMLPTSRLLATVGDYFKSLGVMGKLPAAINLVTGPSRTADIELELSIGVHGPGRLHAVLYDD